MGIASAVVFANLSAAYGTAKSAVGISSIVVMRPNMIMRSIIPVVMAGVLGIYGLIIAVIINGKMVTAPVASSTVLTANCGPQVKVSICGEAATVVDGECVAVGSKTTYAKFCGPGKLTFFRTTCQNTGYKATVIEHTKAEFTTQCEDISAAGINHAVESARPACVG